MPFSFESLEIPGVILIRAKAFPDSRGFFMETYKSSDFAAHGIFTAFVQDNYSYSVQNTLRGLHYQQEPRAQAKLVIPLAGEIFDAVVDIRRKSPTYGHWVGIVLSADSHEMLYVPLGFAHGFCVLSEAARVMYKTGDEYTPELDAGIVWNDPDIGIEWPIANPIVSDKDAQLPPLRTASNSFDYEASSR